MLFYLTNVYHFASVLYNFFSVFIIIGSVILLVAMIGVIIMTLDFEYRATNVGSVKEHFLAIDQVVNLRFN